MNFSRKFCSGVGIPTLPEKWVPERFERRITSLGRRSVSLLLRYMLCCNRRFWAVSLDGGGRWYEPRVIVLHVARCWPLAYAPRQEALLKDESLHRHRHHHHQRASVFEIPNSFPPQCAPEITCRPINVFHYRLLLICSSHQFIC